VVAFSNFCADSPAALKNKPEWFIRQVIVSKFFIGPKLILTSKLALEPVEGGFAS
jgi:hypothetical protein